MDESKNKIKSLVTRYEEVVNSGGVRDYSEEQTKKDFIMPFFEILGWDITTKSDVSAEESQKSGGRVDYGFYLNGRPVFYLEAKPLRAYLDKEEYARQAIAYSWNKGVDYAVLTDFEGLKVFNAQLIEGSLVDRLIFEINYKDYLEDFDRLWLLSKQSFAEKLLDKYADKYGKKLKKVSVGDKLYKDIQECRELLIESFRIYNDNLTPDLIDEGVQKLLDRLVFLRVAEDRGIEKTTLKELSRDLSSQREKLQSNVFQAMVTRFRELDDVYNSDLFSEHPFENWNEDNGATEESIDILSGKKGYNEYDFKFIPADILGGVYENYLGYRLKKLKKGVSVSKDAKKRKEQGIYYTPVFIVDYIVKNALGPVLDKCQSVNDLKKIKVLDPACGSGSFLIKALEIIYEKYKEFGVVENSTIKSTIKRQILLDNIYGVDLDKQAIEITRLNLLISALDRREKLPFLDNIKNGNSLISGTDEELKKYFGKNFRDKKPLNWQEEFPEVFKQGGFDVIIGNPPYVSSLELSNSLSVLEKDFLKNNFKSAIGNFDLYVLFLERSLSLIKNEGNLSFIVPNKFLVNNYGIEIRNILLNYSILQLINFSNLPIFKTVGVYPIVIVVQKQSPKSNHIVAVGLVDENYSTKYSDYSQNSWLSNKDKIITFSEQNSNEGIIDKINKKSINIGSLATVNSGTTGFDYTNYGKLISQSKSKGFIKFIITRNVEPYSINWGKTINYLKRKFSTPYFDVENAIVTEGRKNLYKDKNKIVIRGMSKKVVAGLDNEGCALGVGTYAIIKSKIDNSLLLAFLNSKLISFYYISKFQNKHLAGGYLAFNADQIKQIPIFDFDKNGKIETKKVLINLARKLHDNYDTLFKTPENSERWNAIKSEIEKTDRKIDEEVYNLYGLTEEEIEIIENKK
ncbi:MAG: N-6 DNA methylase [Patescibacteria group bacterium]